MRVQILSQSHIPADGDSGMLPASAFSFLLIVHYSTLFSPRSWHHLCFLASNCLPNLVCIFGSLALKKKKTIAKKIIFHGANTGFVVGGLRWRQL
jgi:hypothetical protein